MARFWGVILLFVLAVEGDEECVVEPKNYCRCRTSSGNLQLDISFLFPYPVHPTPKDPSSYNYTYSPCTQTDCASPSAAVCQYVILQTREVGIGRTSNITWTVQTEKPLAFTILYGDGDKDKGQPARSGLVQFQWTKSDMRADFVEEDQGAQEYFFSITGNRIAALSGNSGSGGVAVGVIGLVILSLAVVGVVLYLVIGGLYMYRVKGARGVEVVPNYAFWREIPYLIWDGCLFTISPCYTRRQQYQSL